MLGSPTEKSIDTWLNLSIPIALSGSIPSLSHICYRHHPSLNVSVQPWIKLNILHSAAAFTTFSFLLLSCTDVRSEWMNERMIGHSCLDVHKSAFPCREPVLLCARDTFLRLTIKPVPLLRDCACEDCYYVVGWTFFSHLVQIRKLTIRCRFFVVLQWQGYITRWHAR